MTVYFPGLVLLTPSQESKQSCICVLGVPSQESKQSCICVLGVPSQESKQSCICVLGVPNQESKQSCICVLGVSIFLLSTIFLLDLLDGVIKRKLNDERH
jgi:hypothetical protein